jgi:hypothetical protein
MSWRRSISSGRIGRMEILSKYVLSSGKEAFSREIKKGC